MKASASVLVRKIRAVELALIRQQEKLAALKRRQPPEPAVWHLVALLADSVDGWEPQYRY